LLVAEVDRIAGTAQLWSWEVPNWRWVKADIALADLLGCPGGDPAETVANWGLKNEAGRRLIGPSPTRYRGASGAAARRLWLGDLHAWAASATAAAMHRADGRKGAVS
jgi:hypothetical protein